MSGGDERGLRQGRWGWRRWAGLWAAMLLPVVALYAVLLRAFRAVPMFDDYPALLGFGLTLRGLSGGERWLWIAASQHGEYKLIFEHAIAAALLLSTGRVPFGVLIWLGNGLALGVGWALWRMFFAGQVGAAIQVETRALLFLPVVYLLFQLNYAENFDWAMCGLQTFPVVLFSLLALGLLFRPEAVWWAAGCACLACLASGNGFVLLPIGLWVHLRRALAGGVGASRAAGVWVGSFLLAGVAYGYHYRPVTGTLYVSQAGMGAKALFFLSFAGAAAETESRWPVRGGAVVLGVVVVLTFAHACWRRAYRTQPAIFCMAIWVLVTAALVAQRRIGGGFALSLTLRYKIYSDLLLIFCYGYAAERVRESRWAPRRQRALYAAAFVAVVGMAVTADVAGARYLMRRQRGVEAGLDGYAVDPSRSPEVSISGGAVPAAYAESSRRLLTEAVRAGIYRLPERGRR